MLKKYISAMWIINGINLPVIMPSIHIAICFQNALDILLTDHYKNLPQYVLLRRSRDLKKKKQLRE